MVIELRMTAAWSNELSIKRRANVNIICSVCVPA